MSRCQVFVHDQYEIKSQYRTSLVILTFTDQRLQVKTAMNWQKNNLLAGHASGDFCADDTFAKCHSTNLFCFVSLELKRYTEQSTDPRRDNYPKTYLIGSAFYGLILT